jgi:cytochrome c553
VIRAGSVLLVAILYLQGGAALADDAIGGDMVVTRGMKPWEGCGECHDLDGVAPNGHFPNLAGQKGDYFLKQMADFRDGKRMNDHGQMGVSARETTGDKLDQVAAYFATLPSPPPQAPAEFDVAGAARARLLITEGDRVERIPACDNCHGLNPKHDVVTPCLEAQQAKYLEKQLADFRTAKRANDPDAVMQKVAQRLSEQDAALLSAYLARLPRPDGGACGAQR